MPRHICRISHVMLAMSEADAIANQAEDRKRAKYAELLVSHHFVPVAIETSGVFGQEVLSFIRELGSCLQAKTGEPQSHHHMKQEIAVAMQQGNVVMELGTMTISFLNLTDRMCVHALAWCTNHHLLLYYILIVLLLYTSKSGCTVMSKQPEDE